MEEIGRSVIIYSNDTLAHHGVKGQKYGKRQYQDYNGKVTALGRIHYGYGDPRESRGEEPSSSRRQASSQATSSPSVSPSKRSLARINRTKSRQKWGTNLTGKDPSTMTSQELDAEMARARKEKEFYNLQQESRPERFAKAKNIAKQFAEKFISKAIEKGTERLSQLAVDKATDWLTEKLGANPNNHVDLSNMDLTQLSDKQVQAMAQRQENENKLNKAKEDFDRKVDEAAKAKIAEMKKAENGGEEAKGDNNSGNKGNNNNGGNKGNNNTNNSNKDDVAKAEIKGENKDNNTNDNKDNADNKDNNQNSQQPKKSKAERKREAREKREQEAKAKAEQGKTDDGKDNPSESKPDSSKAAVPTLDFGTKKEKTYGTKEEQELAEMRQGLATVNKFLNANLKGSIKESENPLMRTLAKDVKEIQRGRQVMERLRNNPSLDTFVPTMKADAGTVNRAIKDMKQHPVAKDADDRTRRMAERDRIYNRKKAELDRKAAAQERKENKVSRDFSKRRIGESREDWLKRISAS